MYLYTITVHRFIEHCHGNFGPPNILVLEPNFLRKLVQADHIFLKKMVRPEKVVHTRRERSTEPEQQLGTSVSILFLTEKTFCTPFSAGNIQLWDACNNNVTPGSATENETASVSGTAGAIRAWP